MSAHTSLLGLYEPGEGWLFTMRIGWKYLLMLVVALTPMILWTWWATAASLVIAVVCMLTSGIAFRRILQVGGYLWVMLALLAAYQLIATRFLVAFISPGTVLAAVLAARMLTLTTSTPVLLDALSAGLRPVRLVGGNPDAVALTIALMLRSIPFLAGSIADARDAANARGVGRNPALLLTPAVVGAVAYAQRTGEALHARGLPASTPIE